MVLVVFVANGEVLVANGKVLVANGKVLVANGKGTGRCYLANECMARPIKKEAHVSLFCNGFHVPNDQIGDCVAEGGFQVSNLCLCPGGTLSGMRYLGMRP